jgi:hypothetical protein
VLDTLLLLTSTLGSTVFEILEESLSLGLRPSLAVSDRGWEQLEAGALNLTSTLLPAPWEAVEENGAPSGALLWPVLATGGEPKLTGGPAALRQPHH